MKSSLASYSWAGVSIIMASKASEIIVACNPGLVTCQQLAELNRKCLRSRMIKRKGVRVLKAEIFKLSDGE
jgi:hypothetical protein